MAGATEWCSLNEKGYKMTRLKWTPRGWLNYARRVYSSGGYANTNELPMLETPDHKDMLEVDPNDGRDLVPSNYNWMDYTWEITDQLLPVYDSPKGRIVAEVFQDDYETFLKVKQEAHCKGYRATTSAKGFQPYLDGEFAPGNLI